MDSHPTRENATKDCLPDNPSSSPDSMDERSSESEHTGSTPSPPNSVGPKEVKTHQAMSQASSPTCIAAATTTSAASKGSLSPLASTGIKRSPPQPKPRTENLSTRIPGHTGHIRGPHPAIPHMMLSPYTADPKANERIPLSSYMKLMTLHKTPTPQQLAHPCYPTAALFPPAAMHGQPPLSLPTTHPPQYPNSSKPVNSLPTTHPPQYPSSSKLLDSPRQILQQVQSSLPTNFFPPHNATLQTSMHHFTFPNLMPVNHPQRAISLPEQRSGHHFDPGMVQAAQLEISTAMHQHKVENELSESGHLLSQSPRGRKRTLSQSVHGHRLSSTGETEQEVSSCPTLTRGSVFPQGEQTGCTDGGPESAQSQLKWQAHMVNSWHEICDGALQDISEFGFQVETDKGFNFSVADDSFVCQKKNHFQVTVQILFHRTPKFLKMKDSSIQPIDKFEVHLHGVRFDQVNTVVKLEQSKSDRSKEHFKTVEIEVPDKPEDVIRYTVCRLHFSETTSNNMRKRGKPNPDQKHFSLVVALHAVTAKGQSLPVVSHVSERIIVRASNPGNFDNDCEHSWFKSANPEVIYHHGRVGINTDKPDEALVVCGNIQLTGQLLQASDLRLKRNITKVVDSKERLENVSKLQLYEYQYADGVVYSSLHSTTPRHLGLLAQDLRSVIPDAVKETHSDITLSDGSVVSRPQMVDKDRILMETVGAVQELKHIADKLGRKIDSLECGRSLDQPPEADKQQHCTCCSKHGRRKPFLQRNWSPPTILVILCILICLLFLLVLCGHESSSRHVMSTNQEQKTLGQVLEFWLR